MGSLIICFTVASIIYYYLNYGNWLNHEKSHSLPANVTLQAKVLHQALVKRGVQAKLERFAVTDYSIISVPEARVTIEIEGKQFINNSKSTLSDLQRTYYSLVDGYYTIRIPNSLIKSNLPQALNYVNGIIAHNQKANAQKIAYPLEYSLILEEAC